VNIPDQGIATVILWDVPDHEDVDVRKTYYLNADAVVGKLSPCCHQICDIESISYLSSSSKQLIAI